MNRSRFPYAAIVLLSLSLSAACTIPSTSTALISEGDMETQAALTESAHQPADTDVPPTSTMTAVPSPSITPTPTITPIPTAPPPLISVTANTNCRSGPDTTFPYLGVLLVGEIAEVVAKSTIENYWLIILPDKPEEPCWLSGAYATVEGDTSILPAHTPMPTPVPPIGFDLYLRGFEACGSITYVVFSVKNAGVEILKSANVSIVELDTRISLYGPEFQRFPFAQVVRPVCPPDHGNILNPGAVAYIHVPINPVPHGKNAFGEVMLCTADWLGGDCVTKEIYFLVN